jgi:hypothetical protein
MGMLASAEQDKLDSMFTERMVKEDIKDVSSFDKWLGQQGPYAVGKRDKFFKAWDNRMDTVREQEKYAGEIQLDTLVGGVMNDYYGKLASETDPTKQSAIIAEANQILTQLTEEGHIPYNLSGKTRKAVNDRFRGITGESRTVTNAIKESEKYDQSIKDRSFQGALESLSSAAVEKMVDRLDKGEDFETAYRAITKDVSKYISDKDILTNLDTRLRALKPEDTRPASFKYLDAIEEKLTSTGSPTKDASNIAEIIDIELRDQVKSNPMFHSFVAKEKMGIAIQRTLDTINRIDPDRIDEKFIREEWLIYREEIKDLEVDARNEAIETAITQVAKKYGVPYSMIKFILFPKKFKVQ